MQIFVPVKLAPDVSQLKFDASTGEPLVEACPKTLGDADKCALEEAVRLKEKLGAKVVAATVAPDSGHVRAIRDAYAMGADEGYLVIARGAEKLSTLSVAELLAALIRSTGPYDLILLGSASNDTHSSLVAPMLAAVLDMPVIQGADKLDVSSHAVKATCFMEDGTYTFETALPAVVSITSEANEPRIPTLRDILRSKRLPVKEIRAEELGVKLTDVKVGGVRKYVVPRKRVKFEVSDPSKIEEVVLKFLDALRSEGVL